jgi:hypothetical protein
MGRATGAVVSGALVWAILWNVGTMGAQRVFPDVIRLDQPLDHVPALLGYIVYSVALSLLAGYVTAAVRGGAAMRAVWVLAWIQLALGLVFEVSFWDMTPAWYHVVFLALIVPATVWGGKLRTGSLQAKTAV